MLLSRYLLEDKDKHNMSLFLNYLNEQLNIIIEECKQEESYKTKMHIIVIISSSYRTPIEIL